MISVICAYNNEQILRNVLLKSLEGQTVNHELVLVDNRRGTYRSAAEALNHGGARAKGDYLMFAHQDMWLGSNSSLEDFERTVEAIPDLGVAGVAGMSSIGADDNQRRRWSIEDFGELWLGGAPVEGPEEVQTLDECFLMVPKQVFEKLGFDEEAFDGWDCYGADYSLAVRELGLRAYVVPSHSSHCCLRGHSYPWEFKDLLKYQRRLYSKHRRSHARIYSWFGEISRLALIRRAFGYFRGPLLLRLFPDWPTKLARELSDCDSVLDLGCGHFSAVHRSEVPFSVGVEAFEPYLLESRRKAIHSEYVRADIRRVEFVPRSFDAVLAVEVLEHLTKAEGYEFIEKMGRWARKKVVITTPNGYVGQDPYDKNPLQDHKSGWNVDELRELGFGVSGLSGLRQLRGHKGLVTRRPLSLWARVSVLSERITNRFPELSFQLLAVKRVYGSDHEGDS